MARLRRAALGAELASRSAPVEELDGPAGPVEVAAAVRPYRPRARALAAPIRGRPRSRPPAHRRRQATDDPRAGDPRAGRRCVADPRRPRGVGPSLIYGRSRDDVLARPVDPAAGGWRRRHRRVAAAAVPPDPGGRCRVRPHRRRRRHRRAATASTGSSTACSTPAPSTRTRRSSPFTAADVTVVVPALVLGESALAEIVRCCPGVAAVIAVDDASDPPVNAVDGARVLRLRTNAGPAVARNAGLGAVDDAARRLRRHRRPAGARLARPAARPLRRRPRRARRAARRQRAGRRRRSPATSRATRRSTSDRSRAASRRAPGSATSRPRRSSCAPTPCGRSAASTRRCASARTSTPCGGSSRPAGAAATSRRPSSTTGHAGSWRGARRPARSPTARRRPRSPAPPRRARAGARQRLERRRRGRSLPPATRSPALGGGRRHRRRARPQAARRAGRGVAAARRPSATSTPAGCSPTPGAGRGGRCSVAGVAGVAPGALSPPLVTAVPALLGGGVPRLVDDLAYGVGVWKGVVAEREPAPLLPAFTSWPGRTAERLTGGGTVGRRDAAPHRRHRRVATATSTACARHCPGLVPVVKGNGYGFGRAALAAIAAELADTIAVGTVHELDHVPAGVTPVVLTPTPPAARRPDARSSRSGRSTTSTRSPAGAGRVLVKLASSVRRFGATRDELGALTRAARAAGLDVAGFSIHPPVAGTDDEHLDDIAAWLDVLEPRRRGVGQPPLRRRLPTTCATRWPDRRFRIRVGTGAVARRQARRLHLDADVLDVRPVRAGEHAGYRQRPVPGDGRLVMVGAGTAHGVAPARDGRSPFHFARQRLDAARAAAHAHVDGARAGRRRPAPRAGDVVDVQRPLISTLPRRGALAMTAADDRRRTAPGRRRHALARPRRRARRRPHRRRRDELPRLPASCAAATGRRRRSTGSSTRGSGRCRPASPPRSCSSPASASRCSPAGRSVDPTTVARQAAGRSCDAGSRCTAAGCCSTWSGRARSCPTTARCS